VKKKYIEKRLNEAIKKLEDKIIKTCPHKGLFSYGDTSGGLCICCLDCGYQSTVDMVAYNEVIKHSQKTPPA
jgi:hypothetical protein